MASRDAVGICINRLGNHWAPARQEYGSVAARAELTDILRGADDAVLFAATTQLIARCTYPPRPAEILTACRAVANADDSDLAARRRKGAERDRTHAIADARIRRSAGWTGVVGPDQELDPTDVGDWSELTVSSPASASEAMALLRRRSADWPRRHVPGFTTPRPVLTDGGVPAAVISDQGEAA